MQKNPLLVKTELGQSKATTHDLPEREHIYGKKIMRDAYNASSLLSSWDQCTPVVKETYERDFAKMNKLVVKERNYKKAADLRRSMDVKLLPKYEVKMNASKLFNDTTEPNTAYGRPNYLSKDFKSIVNNDFGN